MTAHRPLAFATALAALALAGCSQPQEQPAEPQAAVVTPTAITPDSGCSIAATGHEPGTADPGAVPESLTLTCDGHVQTLDGQFTNKTSNSYDLESTGIKSALVVDGEARIWHARGPEGKGCMTIQRLDEASASRDECDAERLAFWEDRDPAQEPQPTADA